MVSGDAGGVAELQLVDVVRDRDGWTLQSDEEAVYHREGSGRRGRVRRLSNLAPGVSRRWHAAVIDAGGGARGTVTTWTAAEAVEWVEKSC